MPLVEQKKETPEWNAFAREHGAESGAFLQSWQWGDVLCAQGRDIARYAYTQKSMTKALVLVERMRLPFGLAYCYVPRGPIGVSVQDEKRCLEALLAQSLTSLFVRVDLLRDLQLHQRVCQSAADVQPSTTLLTDLDPSLDTLLASFHQKTRYNIRLAEKKGVEVLARVSWDAYGDAFTDLMRATGRRHGIAFHARAHYASIMGNFHGRDGAARASLFVACRKRDVLAAAMCVDFGGTRTYLHGASSDAHKELMAPYALHYAILQDAKEHGLRAYDWWG
ncbi:peptidoglycan bridge formation glycyltransferase FemA/FemB family protein, partial [Candidatus Uhrbacteria bacterium]|nr:peptidoglycan bridge formation glycyltransferase FemA/FemB family protein [Candidatus Uhrbacteria bacterium]